jgi:anti-sigma-K factor RskA
LNTQEYIASGILESYVMGELSGLERAEVERNIEKYPELKEELAKAERAQEHLLQKAAVHPKASVRVDLFKRLGAEEKKARIISMDHSRIRLWQYAAAACVALALFTSYLAYTYRGKWKSTETDLNELIAQNQRIAQDYNQVSDRIDKIENDLKIVGNPAFKRIVMNGTDNAPDAMALVYWNETTQEVYLDVQKLRELSRESQYQLWVIIDGKPVDAGVFDAANGLVKMKNAGKGVAAFAVTVEPRGGKPTPTLETMQVIGYAAKG